MPQQILTSEIERRYDTLPTTIRQRLEGLPDPLLQRAFYLESIIFEAEAEIPRIEADMAAAERLNDDDELEFLNIRDRYHRDRLEAATRQLKVVRLQIADRATARQAAE